MEYVRTYPRHPISIRLETLAACLADSEVERELEFYMHVHVYVYSDDDDMLVFLSKYELFYERNKPSLQQSLRPATADDMVA